MKMFANGTAAYPRLAPRLPSEYIGIHRRETNGLGVTSQEKTSE